MTTTSLLELSLDDGFAKAVEIAGGDTLKGKCTDDERLSLYAHYKMATVGENTARMPKSLFSPAEVKKHYAWKNLGTMPAEQAKQAYVQLVQSKLEG